VLVEQLQKQLELLNKSHPLWVPSSRTGEGGFLSVATNRGPSHVIEHITLSKTLIRYEELTSYLKYFLNQRLKVK
jgi:hypothetical protein